jgi:hypothetical protein
MRTRCRFPRAWDVTRQSSSAVTQAEHGEPRSHLVCYPRSNALYEAADGKTGISHLSGLTVVTLDIRVSYSLAPGSCTRHVWIGWLTAGFLLPPLVGSSMTGGLGLREPKGRLNATLVETLVQLQCQQEERRKEWIEPLIAISQWKIISSCNGVVCLELSLQIDEHWCLTCPIRQEHI